MRAKQQYDAVVIGAGVGGLMAANVLARKNLSVLVCEQSGVLGGCCSAFRSEGYVFDAAVHHVSGGGPRSLVGQALATVRAPVRFVHLDPMDTLVWPDARFEVPGTWDGLLAALVRAYPRQASGTSRLFDELLRLYRAILGTPGGQAVLERWQHSTFLEFLSSFVDDEELIRVLSGQWGYLGAPPQRLSTVGMCQMLVNYWRDGAHYPIGGTQVIPDALAQSLLRCGGEVRRSCGVRSILVSAGRSVGVQLADNEVVCTSAVISNVDVPQTLTRLLGDRIDPSYGEKVDALEVSAPFFLVYLGLGPEFDPASLPRGFYHYERRLGGPWLYVSSASEVDPDLAPAGKHAFTVVVSLSDEETKRTDWPQHKERKIRQVLGLLDTFSPGLTQHVEVVRAAHPPRPQRRTSNYCGAPYGWAVIPPQAGPRRLSQRMPVDGLYLAGHWTTPGPGVCAVIASGWRAANQVVADAGARLSVAAELRT